jgi:hypothetical protein
MAISRKTFKTVKDILRELDQQRSDARRETPGSPDEPKRATPKRPDNGQQPGASDRDLGRDGAGDQLIG